MGAKFLLPLSLLAAAALWPSGARSQSLQLEFEFSEPPPVGLVLDEPGDADHDDDVIHVLGGRRQGSSGGTVSWNKTASKFSKPLFYLSDNYNSRWGLWFFFLSWFYEQNLLLTH